VAVQVLDQSRVAPVLPLSSADLQGANRHGWPKVLAFNH
jgi:hypothetical protein